MIERNEEFRQIFHQLPERKLVIKANDPEFTIEEITDSYVQMMRRERADLINKPYFDAFPVDDRKQDTTGLNQLADAFRSVIYEKKPHTQSIFRYDLIDPDGTEKYQERYWKTTLFPLFSANGKVSHILQVSSNATNEVLADRELQETKNHLEEALEIGRVGSWSSDVDLSKITCDRIFARMLGLKDSGASLTITHKAFEKLIHPEDVERVRTAFRNAITKGGDYTDEYRVVVHRKTHWLISRGKVQKYGDEIRFSGVAVDVTDQRVLIDQIKLAQRQEQLNRERARLLQQRNKELKTINRTKDEFVALASHQLRTPATAVKQYLAMVLQGYVGEIDDLQREMLSKAFASNERQIQIINQILNAARADTGKLVMSHAPIDLKALVHGICEEMKSHIEEKGHEFTFTLPKEAAFVHADSSYLRMALENILNNANVYTPTGGKIYLNMEVHNRKAKVFISDTGVGIKQADIPKLFDKFSRIHNPLSVQAGGSGIGLYLAAEIFRMHNATIDVESKIGKGSTFIVTLPLASKEHLVGASASN